MFHKLREISDSSRDRNVAGFSLWVWRIAVATSFFATVLRVSPVGGNGQDLFWAVAQFAPLILAGFVALIFATVRSFNVVACSLLIWSVVSVLSSLWSEFPGTTLRQSGLQLLVLGFLAATASTRWQDREVLRGDFRFVFWLITSSMTAGALMWFVSPLWVMGYYSRYQGIFPNPNYAALLAALSLPIGVWLYCADKRYWMRCLVSAAFVVLAVSLFLTGSRGPLVAAILGVMVSLLLSPYRRTALWGMLAATLAAGTFLAAAPDRVFGRGGYLDRTVQGSDFSSGRFDIWARLIDVWRERPILGSGYRTIELLPTSDGFTAHNIYLSVLVELGAVGLAIFFGLLALLVVTGLTNATSNERVLAGAMVTVLIGEMTEASLFGFGGPTSMFSWLVLVGFAVFGYATVKSRRRGTRKKSFFPRSQSEDSHTGNAIGLTPPNREVSRIVSVCMATYNGAQFVIPQIESILEQLGPGDELVIVDDASTDDTVARVVSIGDGRIRIVQLKKNVGHVRAFERALAEAVGDVVLLSDQDDVWIPGRVKLMAAALEASPIVATNWRLVGESDHAGPHFEDEPARARAKFRNLLDIYLGRLPYFGCAIGMRRDVLQLVLPFPKATEAHDLWIAIVGNSNGGIEHLRESTVERRIHGGNLTPVHRRGLRKVLRSRLVMASLTATALARGSRVLPPVAMK